MNLPALTVLTMEKTVKNLCGTSVALYTHNEIPIMEYVLVLHVDFHEHHLHLCSNRH